MVDTQFTARTVKKKKKNFFGPSCCLIYWGSNKPHACRQRNKSEKPEPSGNSEKCPELWTVNRSSPSVQPGLNSRRRREALQEIRNGGTHRGSLEEHWCLCRCGDGVVFVKRIHQVTGTSKYLMHLISTPYIYNLMHYNMQSVAWILFGLVPLHRSTCYRSGFVGGLVIKSIQTASAELSHIVIVDGNCWMRTDKVSPLWDDHPSEIIHIPFETNSKENLLTSLSTYWHQVCDTPCCFFCISRFIKQPLWAAEAYVDIVK